MIISGEIFLDYGFGGAPAVFRAHSAADRDCVIGLIKSEFAAFVFGLCGSPVLNQWPEFTFDGCEDSNFRHLGVRSTPPEGDCGATGVLARHYSIFRKREQDLQRKLTCTHSLGTNPQPAAAHHQPIRPSILTRALLWQMKQTSFSVPCEQHQWSRAVRAQDLSQ